MCCIYFVYPEKRIKEKYMKRKMHINFFDKKGNFKFSQPIDEEFDKKLFINKGWKMKVSYSEKTYSVNYSSFAYA